MQDKVPVFWITERKDRWVEFCPFNFCLLEQLGKSVHMSGPQACWDLKALSRRRKHGIRFGGTLLP